MREELGSRNVSNKTVDMHSPSKISLYLHQKTILSRGLYLVRKLRSNPSQRTLFRLETISLCGDIHQILHKWETCQQFCKSLYKKLTSSAVLVPLMVLLTIGHASWISSLVYRKDQELKMVKVMHASILKAMPVRVCLRPGTYHVLVLTEL